MTTEVLNLATPFIHRGDIDYRLPILRLLRGSSCRYPSIQPQTVVESLGLDWLQLNNPKLSCSGQVFVKILMQVGKLANDEFYGFTQRRCKPGTFSMMSHIALHEKNLHGALIQVVRFFDLVCDEVDIDTDLESESVTLSLSVLPSLSQGFQNDDENFLTDYLLFLFQRLFSWWIGFLIPVDKVSFRELRPEFNDRFIYLLKAKKYQYSEQPALTFSARYLTMPVVRNSTEWAQHVDNMRDGLFSWPNRDAGTSQRVKRMLMTHLRDNHQLMLLPQVAKELAMSSQTLRRRLHEEGNNFQVLVDRLRCDIAIEALYIQQLSIEKVSQKLGFSEARSFSRAFKKWTGIPPTEYLRRACDVKY